jgi:hypothetical protein
MKEIKAIIRPSKLLEETEEFHVIDGLPGVTVSEIKGENVMRSISALLLAGIILTGCARNAELVKRAGNTERGGICAVISPAKPPEMGFADLTIWASLKTHEVSGVPMLKDLHGSPDYHLLVNIDGQALRVSGECFTEDASFQSKRHPESGMGMRYRFQAHVRLRTGAHRIIVAFPYDNVATEREIILEDSTDNLLEVMPSYFSDRRQQGPGSAGATSFREGISGVELSMRGKPL